MNQFKDRTTGEVIKTVARMFIFVVISELRVMSKCGD